QPLNLSPSRLGWATPRAVQAVHSFTQTPSKELDAWPHCPLHGLGSRPGPHHDLARVCSGARKAHAADTAAHIGRNVATTVSLGPIRTAWLGPTAAAGTV